MDIQEIAQRAHEYRHELDTVKRQLAPTDFSMHPGQLLEVRECINKLDRAALRAQARELLRAHTREHIERVVEKMRG